MLPSIVISMSILCAKDIACFRSSLGSNLLFLTISIFTWNRLFLFIGRQHQWKYASFNSIPALLIPASLRSPSWSEHSSIVKICYYHLWLMSVSNQFFSSRSELDHLYSPNASGAQNAGIPGGGLTKSRYAESFHIVLHLSVSSTERPRQGAALIFPWETLPPESARKPMLCFSDAIEMRSVMSLAALKAAGM